MRIVRFMRGGIEGLAVDTADGLKGLTCDDSGYPGDLDSLIAAGGDALAQAHAVLDAAPTLDPATIDWLPPLRRSQKVYCVGLNYHDHRTETGNTQPAEHPTVFGRFAGNLIGHEAAMKVPQVSIELDYEAELVAVVGKAGRYIAKSDALDHVAGYSVFNDGTIRDYQFRSKQWTLGKNFDHTGSFGPAFVTADEVPAGGSGLKIECRLNGQVMQSANTSDLIFDVATLISVISETAMLQPGDLIVTGTPGGVGAARKPQVWMKPGDICEVEIEGVGILRNLIVAEGAQ